MELRHNTGTEQHQERATSGPRPREAVQQTDAPRLLDLKVAAAYMSVSYWTMRDIALGGGVPTVKIPHPRANDGRMVRRILIDRKDLDALIDQNKDAA